MNDRFHETLDAALDRQWQTDFTTPGFELHDLDDVIAELGIEEDE